MVKFILSALLSIAWFPFVFSTRGWEFAAIAFFVGFIVFARKSKCWPLLIILFSPYVLLPLYNSALAVVNYSQGHAKIRVYGLRSTFPSIDRLTRCPLQKMGSILDGREVLTSIPYNASLRLLVQTMGKMPGSYDGPLPTFEKVQQLFLESPPVEITREAFYDGFSMAGQKVKIADIDVEQVLYHLEKRTGIKKSQPNIFRAVLFEDRCLLLQAIDPERGESSARLNSPVALIDAVQGSFIELYQQ